MKFLLVLGLVTVASAQLFFGDSSHRRFPQHFIPRRPTFGGGRGDDVPVDGKFGGSEYHYSWLHDGRRNYVHTQAVSYCSRLGADWAPVSIESEDENAFISGVIGSHRLNWIWTGGQKAGSGWRWPSQGSFNGFGWSHTGGFHRPQPDNREGNEDCLAILNNFYKDGVKWHDVACYHEKPTICERSG